MASRLWLLVEWVDESNIIPSYGVVNVDTLAYNESDLIPGNSIFIRVKHENPRRAKILRISESKRYVKEQKEMLERQDQQVKNVLQLCMRTIKEMKSDNSIINKALSGLAFNAQPQTSSHNPIPHVVVAQNNNSGSDSDSEPNIQVERNRVRNFNRSNPKNTPQYNRKDSIGNHVRSSLNANNSRRRSIISSTPLPSSSSQENIKLCFDQGTQTEETLLQLSTSKIEEMEAVLQNLYLRFQFLVSRASQINMNLNGSAMMSESEQNDEASYLEHTMSDSWVEQNNTEYVSQLNAIPDEIVEQIGGEEVVEEIDTDHQVISSVKIQENVNPNMLRVRRMSAQTTNNIETVNDVDLVPIGNGNAKVPARLLNDIDWNSHTSATRQLLQAVFPRRVLATHSLTGKQSPAFMNKPPKKILDPKLVDDIVKTVSAKCGVPQNLVRNSITIKCTDEAKLYRNRQQYKQARKLQHQNNENIPPLTPSSDESHAIMN